MTITKALILQTQTHLLNFTHMSSPIDFNIYMPKVKYMLKYPEELGSNLVTAPSMEVTLQSLGNLYRRLDSAGC